MSSHKHPLGTIAELAKQALAELDEDLRGDRILPDDEKYEEARNVWYGRINKYPAVIARRRWRYRRGLRHTVCSS